MLNILGPYHQASHAGYMVYLIQHIVNIPVHYTVVKGIDV